MLEFYPDYFETLLDYNLNEPLIPGQYRSPLWSENQKHKKFDELFDTKWTTSDSFYENHLKAIGFSTEQKEIKAEIVRRKGKDDFLLKIVNGLLTVSFLSLKDEEASVDIKKIKGSYIKSFPTIINSVRLGLP